METTHESYEVRCHACDCSFAPGTRQCVHCGARIGGRFRVPGGAVHEGDLEDEVEIGTPGFLRAAVWGFGVLIAVLRSVFRACAE